MDLSAVLKESDPPAAGAPPFRPWRELANLAAIGMEVSWTVLWYRLIMSSGKAASYQEAFLVLGGMLLCAYLLGRGMDFLRLKLAVRRGLLAVLLVLSLVVSLRTLVEAYRFEGLDLGEFLSRPMQSIHGLADLLPVEFVLILVVLLVWWRGLVLGDRQVGPANIIAGFRLGVVALFLYGLLLPLTRAAHGVDSAFYRFMFFSLLAMSAARVSVLTQLRGGQRIPFDRRWMAGILTGVIVVVSLALLAANLVRGRAYELVNTVYQWVIYVILILIAPLLLAFMHALLAIGQWVNLGRVFQSVIDFLNNLQTSLQKLVEALEKLIGPLHIPGAQAMAHLLAAARPFILWICLALAVLVVFLTVRSRVWKPERGDQVGPDSEIETPDLAGLLRSLFRKGLARAAGGLGQGLRLRQAENLLAAARIRRIYARLLRLSSRLDYPRPASRTPLEFLPNLEGLFPALAPELATITHAYLRVRYGELSETSQELERVERAWRRVAQEGRSQLAARKNKKRLQPRA